MTLAYADVKYEEPIVVNVNERKLYYFYIVNRNYAAYDYIYSTI